MEMYTMQQLSTRWGISYQAARMFIFRHREELEGHIQVATKGRQQYLDEVAVKMLEERRRSAPIILKHDDQVEEIEDLRQKMETLRSLYEQSQAELVASQKQALSIHERALEIQTKYTALIEQRDQDAEQMRQTIAEEIRTSARAEVETEIRKEVSAQVDKLEQQHKTDLETIQDLRRQLQAAQQHTSPTERTRTPLRALFSRKR